MKETNFDKETQIKKDTNQEGGKNEGDKKQWDKNQGDKNWRDKNQGDKNWWGNKNQ